MQSNSDSVAEPNIDEEPHTILETFSEEDLNNYKPKQNQENQESIQDVAKKIFKITDPYDRWVAFVNSQKDVTDLLTDELSGVKMTNLPDPLILKDIYHELSDKYNGSSSAKYLITEFGSDLLYKIIIQSDIKKLTDIIIDIKQAFHLKFCDIKPPFLDLKNIKLIPSNDFKPSIVIWTHVTKGQLGKIKDIAKRLNITHGDYVFMIHLCALNVIYKDQKANCSIGYRKYVKDNGYMSELREAIQEYHNGLIKYIRKIYPHLKNELRQQKNELKEIQNNNMQIDPYVPNSIQVQFPEQENINRIKEIIKEAGKFIPDSKQRTIDDY